jgi:DNA repair exonuclease SbcCD ATPase subunit
MSIQTQVRRLEKEVDRIKEKISEHDDFFKDLKELIKIYVYENTKTAIKLQEYKEENEEYLAQKEKEMAELKKEWDRRYEQKEKEMAELKKEWDRRYEQKEKEMAEFREEWRKYHEKKEREMAELKKEWDRRYEQKEKEMAEFREEWRKYHEKKEREMAELKKEWDRRYEQKEKEMAKFREEWREYREKKEKEMAEFREEWRKYHEKKDKEIEKLNKMWGDLVNKWGTMVEDIIVPGIPAVLDRRFNLQVKRLLQNAKSKINGRSREYDVIVLAGDYVFVIYVKSTFREKHFEDFENALREFPEFFPEYKEYKLVPVISAFNFEEGTINKATKRRWLALQMGGDYLDFVNDDKVKLPQTT